jgi:hypothetical protein
MHSEVFYKGKKGRLEGKKKHERWKEKFSFSKDKTVKLARKIQYTILQKCESRLVQYYLK